MKDLFNGGIGSGHFIRLVRSVRAVFLADAK